MAHKLTVADFDNLTNICEWISPEDTFFCSDSSNLVEQLISKLFVTGVKMTLVTEEGLGEVWFQHNGATAQTSILSALWENSFLDI